MALIAKPGFEASPGFAFSPAPSNIKLLKSEVKRGILGEMKTSRLRERFSEIGGECWPASLFVW
jgi:hypothetical protein